MDDISFFRVSVPDICVVSLIIIWLGSHLLTAAQLSGVCATFILFYIAAYINLGGSVLVFVLVVTFYVFYLYLPVDE